MSYRLINSNELAIKYPEVNDMPCIYADIPNGLNGDFYDLSVYPKIVENLEQPTVCDIEQIRAEIDQKQYDFMSDGDYNEGIRFGLMLAYQIIDKYR